MTAARMPAPRLVPVLTAIGASALAVAVAAAAIIGTAAPEAALWVVPMAALFAGGAWAARVDAAAVAARRSLLAGTVAIVWMAGGLVVAIASRHLGGGGWLVAADTAMLALDVALPASILALFAIYPDGVIQRSYERWVVRAAAALVVLVPLVLLLARSTLEPMLAFGWLGAYTGGTPVVASPLHVAALGFLGDPATACAHAAFGVLIALAPLLLVLRFLRFDGRLRQQSRWPLAACALAATQPLGDGLAAAGLLPRIAVDASMVIVIVALSCALAVGLLRPDLFDLDRLVRRTLVYGALVAATVVGCIGLAAAAGVAAAPAGLVVAVCVAIGVTLIAEPLRRSIARRAASWAYGERVSGPELLRRLGDALEHTLEPTELARTLAATIREGLGVAWVRLALDDGPVAIAGSMPPAAPAAGARGATSSSAETARDTPPSAAPAAGARSAPTCVPLAYGSEQLGVLELASAVPALDPVVVGNLARQAALAMGNARMAVELRERATDLAASRMRIVEAQEAARRRLERDIHDGVQQELVALIAKIGLARGQLARDPEAVGATLADLQGEVRQALADLRELASGIHPSVLGDRGLVEAIEARASRLPLGVTIECAPELRGARFPQAVEGAAYFVVCEGFANALKHSGAERVIVRLRRERDALALELSDDGRGFDPASAGGGSGLGGLADRVDALGGVFAVRAAPGAGTVLRAGFPIAADVPALGARHGADGAVAGHADGAPATGAVHGGGAGSRAS